MLKEEGRNLEEKLWALLFLFKAVEYIEEASKIWKELGKEKELGIALNNASVFYSELAEMEEEVSC